MLPLHSTLSLAPLARTAVEDSTSLAPDPASEAAKQQRFWYAMYLGEAPAQTFDGLAEKEDASRIKVPATTKQCHLPTQRRS